MILSSVCKDFMVGKYSIKFAKILGSEYVYIGQLKKPRLLNELH